MGAMSRSSYVPQLDGLRAVAVILVILHHYGIHPSGGWDWGPIGPAVFFMLSGYLVTRSMGSLERTSGRLGALLTFHFRRLCRLMPVLLLLVVAGSILGYSEFSDAWTWHLSFATNFHIVNIEEWCGGASHLWSLGVQEQFYLLWPLLLLAIPRNWLLPSVMALALLGVAWRMGCIVTGASSFTRWLMLPGSLEAFASGAIVAVFANRSAGLPLWVKLAAVPVAALMFAMSTALRYLPQDSLLSAWVEVPESLFFGWLLFRLLDPGSWPSRILSHPWAAGVGKLSYGLFLFHTLVGMVVSESLAQSGLQIPRPVLVISLILITTGLAAASYYTIERPILQWSKNVILPDPAPIIGSLRILMRRVFPDSSSGR